MPYYQLIDDKTWVQQNQKAPGESPPRVLSPNSLYRSSPDNWLAGYYFRYSRERREKSLGNFYTVGWVSASVTQQFSSHAVKNVGLR